MGRGLPVRGFRIFAGGGIDTKTDPRLEPAGNLIEVENMYYLKTGELRLRNGFVKQFVTRNIASAANLFVTAQGSLETISPTWLGQANVAYPLALKYAATGQTGWERAQARQFPYPVMRASISGIEAANGRVASAAPDLADGDAAYATGAVLASWIDAGGASTLNWQIKEQATGKLLSTSVTGTLTQTNSRPAISVAGGSSWLVTLYADTAGVRNIKALVTPANNATAPTAYTVVVNDLNAAQPWFDAKPIPGGNLIALAYRANGGGVTCLIFNPATGAVTSTVNTAAVDATMCLGFLDDSLATGNMYLATAGATAGIVVRTMSATTMAVSAANTIDAATVAGVRNITGHINTGATNYVVLYDVAGSVSYFDKVNVGRWTGSAAVAPLAPSFSLYSRTAKYPDGKYYFVGAYDSTVQPAYSLLGTDDYNANGGNTNGAVSQCQIMPQNGGGRRAFVCSLSSPFTGITGDVSFAASRALAIVTPGGPVTHGRAVQLVTITSSLATLCTPRELGGTTFFPGGIIHRDDGLRTEWAVCPFYPEAATVASSATGSMTASGAYSYRYVYARKDVVGRITRSAGSVPVAITLGAGDGRVTHTLQNPRLQPAPNENYTVEIYRAGPAASGATQYNKVGEAFADAVTPVDTLTFIDTMSDANAAFGELLYSTGNVLENFVTPSCNLLEVCGNRVGIVNAENPTEFWPSLEYKAGQGLRFNPLMAINVTGDNNGGITALAAMDGRWILFKKAAVYVISGAGPNDLGQGSFAAPQAVSLSIGTMLPGSVIATPDGIMFQGAAGIYLLDRGLGLTYLGAPVEQYTLAENAVDAALVSGVTQVRFVMPSGRCLVWDYQQKRWTTFALRVDSSTIVACANAAAGWFYMLADGTLMLEQPSLLDNIGTNTAIVPRVGFPHLALSGINGFQRIYAIEVLGSFEGAHTLVMDLEYDYSGAPTESRSIAILTGSSHGPFQYEVKPAQQKSGAVKITLRATNQTPGSGAFRLSGLTLWAGMKQGSNIPYTKRLT